MFERVIGQTLPKEMLRTAIKTNKLSHAYIFHGRKGVGKTTMALEFAKSILCEQQSACGECHSCKQFYSTSDVRIISSEKSISVENVREITSEIFLKPFHFPKKIYIITEAEKMTVQAQNALLKVFEEPPSYAIIILVTSNISMLLPTILSRGTEVRFPPLSINELKEYFIKNNRELPAEEILLQANGSVTEAISLSQSEVFLQMRASAQESIFSFLSRKTTGAMLRVYRDFLTYEESADKLCDLFFNCVHDCTVTDNSLQKNLRTIQPVTLSLSAASCIYRELTELSARLSTNAGYALSVLSFLIQVRNHLNEERNF